MKPIENRWPRHARRGQDRPKARTTIAERGQVSVVGSAHSLDVSADQHRDVGVALRDSAKYLPTSAKRLDVADAWKYYGLSAKEWWWTQSLQTGLQGGFPW
jgi:hypothetical protein